MNAIKKATFALVSMTLFFGSFAPVAAQDASGGGAADGSKVYLPMVKSQAGPEADRGPEVATLVISEEEQEAALRFWTRQQLASTQPMEMPAQAGPAEVDAAAIAAAAQETLTPGESSAGAPAPDAVRVAQAAFTEDWATLATANLYELDEVLAPAGTSQTYSSYFGNKLATLQNILPHRWTGRISFSTPNGTSYCSGTSISGNVMVTAAHCLYDSTNNRWYSNWVFTPAYRNGSAPYGVFAAQQCWVLTNWVNLSGSYSINGWVKYDVGVCKMRNNAAGQTLNNAVGWAGRQWNYGYVRHFHSMGYPFRNTSAQLITDAGKYMHICAAESFQQTTDTRGMGCNMANGKSGGPSLVGYAPGVVSGWVDGVYSGYYVGTPNMYFIRFTNNNIVPLCTAAAC